MRIDGLVFEATTIGCCFIATPGEPMVVGRKPPRAPRNVRVQDRAISREQFRVIAGADGCAIEDAGSAGGTFINDEAIRQRTPVTAGDRIKVTAATVFEVRALSGESLTDRMARGRLEIVPALQMARAVTVTLARLHERGECHGAVQPDAILLADEDRVTLLNHGWTVVDEAGKATCAPFYCAPETYRKGLIVPASDLHALGCVLYAALTGRAPFANDDWEQAMMLKEFGAPPAMESGWPQPLVWIISMLLDGDLQRRPDAARVLEKIDECIARIEGGPWRQPITWILESGDKAIGTVKWRDGVELIVVLGPDPQLEGLASYLRQRFIEFTGHRPSVEPEDVERFLTVLVPMEIDGITARRVAIPPN